MFTGIIQKIAPVLSVTHQGKILTARIKKPAGWKLSLGQSVAIDGICSTVTSVRPGYFEVEYMPETLEKTTAQVWQKGKRVNLECSLTLRDLVDGGIVSGHVDACGRVEALENEGASKRVTFAIPASLSKYVARKGSITVNGVNLTVTEVTKKTFGVALIPYTLSHTNLGLLRTKDRVNVEVDLVARYVERFMRDKR
jgi:riboflavin synthase